MNDERTNEQTKESILGKSPQNTKHSNRTHIHTERRTKQKRQKMW